MKKNIKSELKNILGKIGLRKTKWILWALTLLILIIVYSTTTLSLLSFIGFSALVLFTKWLQTITSLADGMGVVMNRNKWFKEHISETSIRDKRDLVEKNSKDRAEA